MRKALIGLFITATAVAPMASASAQTWGGRDDRHAQHEQERADRQAQRDQRQAQRSEQRAERFNGNGGWQGGQDRTRTFGNGNLDRGQFQQQFQGRSWQGGNAQPVEQRHVDRGSNWAGDRQNGGGDRNRNSWGGSGGSNWDHNRSGNWDRNRSGSWNRNGGDWNRDHRDWNNGGWNRGWRNDNRYDWQHYRSYNRDLFHTRPYYAPYRGYRYNRFSIGFFLEPLFYSQNYWISDPWYYRLPPAPPGTQWVRYYNDVLLVDVYSGEVVDVIYDFFW